ncbi:hypothetical protein M5E06_31005 [Azospirillum sp. A1-3]|uniref:hypothetical protein n=1 Tax=Azospirillum sp. A1-3 TaxID=185874 RepID=UPI002076DEA7|nr:hypothetical protein [Azospirillum sp. A1-3]MCM8738550.1 hypothetical protein [Azospirillum sp. A1-3]MCM8738553.1 hypothetical protein [Azospirillum sp. A1-3]
MPLDFHQVWNPDDRHPSPRLHRQAIIKAEVGRVKAGGRFEARKANLGATLHTTEEGSEGLGEPAQHLLLG